MFDYAAATVEIIDCGDASLALRRFGSGPALLLVHGFPVTGYTWRHLLPQLSQHYTCHVVDLAGMGDSQWNKNTGFGFDDHARRLKTLVDRIGLQRYHLMAQDTGATTARRLALIDGARVARLVLFNTEIPGHRPPWIQIYQWLIRWMPGTDLSFRLLMRSRLFLRSGMAFGGCFTNLDLIDGDFREHFAQAYVRSARRTQGMTSYLEGIHWNIVDEMRQRHAELRMPVLLVWGKDDPTFPVGEARAMLPQFPDVKLVEVADAKLLLFEEQPQACLDAILPFLAA